MLKAYCVQCRTGSEHIVARQINHICKGVLAIAPVRVLLEKRQRLWEQSEKALLPGYVFLYVDNEPDFKNVRSLSRVFRLLQYDIGARELTGSDYTYAKWIFRHKGRIEPSKALIEGSTVKVIDGPLANGIGTIVKLDRHKKRAIVEFEFEGVKKRVSLSVVDLQDKSLDYNAGCAY